MSELETRIELTCRPISSKIVTFQDAGTSDQAPRSTASSSEHHEATDQHVLPEQPLSSFVSSPVFDEILDPGEITYQPAAVPLHVPRQNVLAEIEGSLLVWSIENGTYRPIANSSKEFRLLPSATKMSRA